ncbi:MAG: hypothetical protein HZA10_09035 [Nitrospirae bacterium]|nr:hypothetical protein [Nitrospirota bacterium]
MNKPIIKIFLMLIIAVVISGSFVLQKTVYPASVAETPAAENISPFGIMAAFSGSTLLNISALDKTAWAGEKFRSLGAKWSRANGDNIMWYTAEPQLGGGYNWSQTDAALKGIYQNGGEGFNTVLIVSSSRAKGTNYNIAQENETYFKNFVKALVERYNGDGINDCNPNDCGSNVKVKYWQAENEPFPNAWLKSGGTLDGYVRFVELLSQSAKEADPDAKIVLGAFSMLNGISVPDFSYVVSSLKAKNISFEAVDTHHWQYGKNYQIPVSSMRSILNSNGYNNVKIFSLEYGSHAGDPTVPDWPPQTERDQTKFLIEGYVYNIANGVSLINWNNLVEWSNFGNVPGSMYNFMGLIADGQNGDATGAGVPRLSYYTYKKMADVLGGSDWNNIQIINETNNIYIYKFTKNNKPVYVAWWEYLNEPAYNYGNLKTVTFAVDFTGNVTVTKAVPNTDTGAYLNENDYPNFFETGTTAVAYGEITLSLGESPVFLEGSICSDNDGDGYGTPGDSSCPNGGTTDCNDNNPQEHPNQIWYQDIDGDGYSNGNIIVQCSVPAGYKTLSELTAVSGDCDDYSALKYPEASDVICDGVDNNCDGIPDDGYVPVPTTCGIGACAAAGTSSCQGGVMVNTCTPGAPSAELCDGIDNNCNGQVDDGLASIPTTCGIGACAAAGTSSCQGGVMVNTCTPGAPGTEGPFANSTCSDLIDNNCDGLTDASDSNCQPAPADLIITYLFVPSTARSGLTITVKDTTKNNGTNPAGASYTKFYLSANAVYDVGADTYLGKRSVASLAAGASTTGNTYITIPTGLQSGTYYIIAVADADEVIIEVNETNNNKFKSVNITK